MLTGLAALAGLLGHLMRNANERRKTTVQRSILEAASSGFIGFLSILLCRAMGVSYEWSGFIVGVTGWLGATVSIQLFERIVRRKLGIPNVDVVEEAGRQPADAPGANPADTAGDR